MKFHLIGQTTIFTAIRFYNAAGFIPSVIGHTADGRQTVARVVDVTFLNSES